TNCNPLTMTRRCRATSWPTSRYWQSRTGATGSRARWLRSRLRASTRTRFRFGWSRSGCRLRWPVEAADRGADGAGEGRGGEGPARWTLRLGLSLASKSRTKTLDGRTIAPDNTREFFPAVPRAKRYGPPVLGPMLGPARVASKITQ